LKKGKKSNRETPRTKKIKKPPNNQLLRDSLEKSKIKFNIRKMWRKKVLLMKALFSFSLRLEIEKNSKKRNSATKENSPAMNQKSMA